MFLTIGTFETRPRAKFGFVTTRRGQSVFVPVDLVDIPLNNERVAVLVWVNRDGSLRAVAIHPMTAGPIPQAWYGVLRR